MMVVLVVECEKCCSYYAARTLCDRGALCSCEPSELAPLQTNKKALCLSRHLLHREIILQMNLSTLWQKFIFSTRLRRSCAIFQQSNEPYELSDLIVAKQEVNELHISKQCRFCVGTLFCS